MDNITSMILVMVFFAGIFTGYSIAKKIYKKAHSNAMFLEGIRQERNQRIYK